MNSFQVQAHACGSCGRIYYNEADEEAKRWAEKCCRCSFCEAELKGGGTCRDCRDSHEKASLEKAEIAQIGIGGDYAGNLDDNYWFDDDSLLEHFESIFEPGDDPEQFPDFVWAAEPEKFPKLDMHEYVYGLLEEWYEDAIDSVAGLDELQAAADAFWEKNKGMQSWYPGRKKIDVRHLKEEFKKRLAEED